jgi:hypothetical protein
MMTRQLQVSILAAPLAAIDRRALSQAWYSALRLARDGRPAPLTRVSEPHGAQARKRGRIQATPGGVRNEAHAPPGVVGLKSRPMAGYDAAWRIVDRRAERSPLAGQIESVLFDPRSQVKRASFTIGSGRVHVLLQSKGDRVALVALCPPALRGIVARALAQARFALAARGIQGELEAKGAWWCS